MDNFTTYRNALAGATNNPILNGIMKQLDVDPLRGWGPDGEIQFGGAGGNGRYTDVDGVAFRSALRKRIQEELQEELQEYWSEHIDGGFVRHFTWQDEDGGGRIAVTLDSGGNFVVAQISGPAPGPGILRALLCDLNLRTFAEALHLTRLRPWRVDIRQGMSGCETHLLRVLEDRRLCNAPVRGRLHISMVGKLNEGWKGWLGDLFPLLESADPDGSKFRLDDARVIHPDEGWNEPGVSVPSSPSEKKNNDAAERPLVEIV